MQAGNGKGSNASCDYTYIDKNGPDKPKATLNSDNTITVSSSDAGVGLGGYLLTNTPDKPSGTASAWNSVTASSWKSGVLEDGTYYAWARDGLNNVSEHSDPVVIESYFKENKTVDGGPASSTNPTIPAGFKPYEQSDGEIGDTGTAYWKDDNGKPSAESVKQGLVIESEDLGEFVWIPVPDINKMIMCQSKKYNDQCNIIKKDGQLYCTTHGSYDICGKLYSNGPSDLFVTSRTNQTYTKNSGRREPDLLSSYDKTTYLKDIGLTQSEFEKNMIEDFKKMAVSTYDHGGFWIGRYETSLSDASSEEEGKDGTFQSKRNIRSLKGNSKSSDESTYKWYGMYAKEKTENANYSTHMFWRM